MNEPRKEAERTCVGCRGVAPQQELRRYAVVNGEVAPDPDRRLPGRGAWLHDTEACRALADRRGALARALRLRDARTQGRRWARMDRPGSPPDLPDRTGRNPMDH